ncbi:MAG: alpha/beta fold hydrolase [Suipraeoptans sp.]
MKNSVFKSPERRDKLRAYYNGILGTFPFEQKYLETTYGRTFVLISGEASNPPVILLHGSNSNSAFWFPEIMALSSNFRVYAIDIIGEAGNSEEYRPDLETDAFATWLKEVQIALGASKAIVIGNSLGGWMALKFATTYPECVSKLILIASAGIAPVYNQFLQNVQETRQDDGTVLISEDIIGESGIPKEILEFMNLISQSYNPIQELPLYSDEQLLKLNMPVVFIDGEDDVIINARESAQRLISLIPAVKTMLIAGCGHSITNAIDYIQPYLF